MSDERRTSDPTIRYKPIDWLPVKTSKYLDFKAKLLAHHRIIIPFAELTAIDTNKGIIYREVWNCQKSFHVWSKQIGRKISTKFKRDEMVLEVELLDE